MNDPSLNEKLKDLVRETTFFGDDLELKEKLLNFKKVVVKKNQMHPQPCLCKDENGVNHTCNSSKGVWSLKFHLAAQNVLSASSSMRSR